tara:strand:- start:459 stop:686 length:228 start_codon:yes stop_codon:yes gene_type:complete
MNEANAKEVWAYIRSCGDKLVGKLPESPRHPKGRNPYAHLALCLKNKYGQSYKDIPDEDIDEVYAYLDYLVTNPY